MPARKAPLRSSGPPERRTRVKPKNAKRAKENHERAYGPEERVEWIRTLHCANCDMPAVFWDRKIVSAHIKNAGMSRKADARFTIPLCETRFRDGCHDIQHGPNGGWHRLPRLDTPEKREAAAARTEKLWQAYQGTT